MSKISLQNDSRVAVIGGGPAGSLCAVFIQKYARDAGIDISTTIFDGKDFLQKGPRGCNLCAGVISNSLHAKLNSEGIGLPEGRIIKRVRGYRLHLNGRALSLSPPPSENDSIATVFRGNGPRFSAFPEVISFDDFLLTFAQDYGAAVVYEPIKEIQAPADPAQPLILTFGSRRQPKTFTADLVVGAFGLNTRLTRNITAMGFGYRPPATLKTFQAEFKLDAAAIDRNFGDSIHVFMPRRSRIRFATVIPKGDFVTVTLIGKKEADREFLKEFLALPEVPEALSKAPACCFCYPKIAVSPAHNPFTHRLVMVGDASFSRHYKNGIESAFVTARLAAAAAVKFGIDAESLRTHFYRPAREAIIKDNFYGRLLFFLNDIILAAPLVRRLHIRLAENETRASHPHSIRFILWQMFTGNISYKKIFQAVFSIRLQVSLLSTTIKLIFLKFRRKPN